MNSQEPTTSTIDPAAPRPPGSSPFDIIRHADEAGEFWLAREMQPFLDYSEWRNFQKVIHRSMSACRNNGLSPDDHFVEVNKVIEAGKGAKVTLVDYRLSRYACHLVAMNGDPDKPEVAAAQGYFAVMTRLAEVGLPKNPFVPPPQLDRPWSVRFREYFQPHYRAVNEAYPGCFTVVTTLSAQMLTLEDELIRHLFEPQSTDRPDVSIGLCWSNYRNILGLPPSSLLAPLRLPNREDPVMLKVYPDHERGVCERWFNSTYLPRKLPAYLDNKKEFKEGGTLARASVADHTCRNLTGKPAELKPIVRRYLDQRGGFCQIGTPMVDANQAMLLWLE